MGLFSALFSENKRKWLSQLGNRFEEENEIIIKNFFIQDNISFEKFHANSKWESSQLSIYQDENDLTRCTITYRNCYSKNVSNRNLNNSELGHNNHWFYLGYPDVAKWFEENYSEIKFFLEKSGAQFSPFNHQNLQILRFVVTMYKNNHGKLELEI